MMKYKIGEKVTFEHDVYDTYYNTDSVFIGTVSACGTIKSYNEEYGSYEVVTDKGITYNIEENEIIYSEREKKIKNLEEKIIQQKINIANKALKMRDALWDDHPARIKESSKEYEKYREELYDLMSEYDEIEDEYIMLTAEQ